MYREYFILLFLDFRHSSNLIFYLKYGKNNPCFNSIFFLKDTYSATLLPISYKFV